MEIYLFKYFYFWQEGMLTRLCKWAREGMEPLRSYAIGKMHLD